ncbi:MAG: glycolate oxidase subunit GlcF [Candidatus Pacebacteria bacterium]|nr:glycolate oxidase subunit GlcF [Candidatus Paceibacterota bacterium]
MRTVISAEQQQIPWMVEDANIIGSCVHCGMCTATCPTFVLLGDELDSPRGRIYLIKSLLEANEPASRDFVTHIDRCLSCLSCRTTCPSEVDYMRLVDHARAHIDETYQRPWRDQLIRGFLAAILPYPKRLRRVFALGILVRPPALLLMRLLPPSLMPARIRAGLRLLPRSLPRVEEPTAASPAKGSKPRMRVTILAGCAQSVLAPEINRAAASLLAKLGCEVLTVPASGCCGALTHHLGREAESQTIMRRLIDDWWPLTQSAGGLDRIVITTSGCGTVVKDWGYLLKDDPNYADKARHLASLTRDVTEVISELCPDGRLPLVKERPADLPQRIAYHSACSLQHGQEIKDGPARLLTAAGFTVTPVAESHLCCGSAGTYNLLQPVIAEQLRDRKIGNILAGKPDAIAAGNLGCMTQLASATDLPIYHIVKLLDRVID